MKTLNEYMTYNEFLEDYTNFNEKSKYFKITRQGQIDIKKPSFVLEFGYMYLVEKYEKCLKYFDTKDILVKKEKKIKRHSSLEVEKLEESFFRSLFNRDRVHTVSLANELIRRDKERFFEIMYMNAKVSDDEYRLIKIYLFEIMYSKLGLNLASLENVVNYFTSSKEGYGNVKNVDELYAYIYENKFGNKLEINNKMNEENTCIYEFLKRGE